MLEIVKISGATTNGEYGLVEVTVRASEARLGTSTPTRTSGSMCSLGSSRSTSVTNACRFPWLVRVRSKSVPHTFIAETDEARALIGFQPFLFEGFLHEVGEPAGERVLPPPLEAPPGHGPTHPHRVA